MENKNMDSNWLFDPEAFDVEYEERQAILRKLAEEGMDEDLVLEADDLQEWRNPDEDDCPLDGDAESALASAGFGTDEDYGGYTHDWEDEM
jgi:hypothetical protein